MFFFKNKKRKQDKIVLRKRSSQIKRRSADEPVKFSRMLFYFLALLFCGAAVYVFIFSAFLEIKTIGVSGTKELAGEDILKDLKLSLGGKYLGLVPKNNFILVSKNKLEKNLSEHFRKIKSLEVKKKFPDALLLNIEERKSLILWCSGGPCYIVDESGYAYAGIDLDSPKVVQNNLIALIDTGARPVIVGERILNEEYVSFLISLREEIGKGTGINVNTEWRTPSIVAEEVEIDTEEGWRLYFSENIKPEKAIRTLKTFLDEEIGKEKRNELEYVDLRVENKVYYKLKNTEESKSKDQLAGKDINREMEEKKKIN